MSEDTKPTLEEALKTIEKLSASIEKLEAKNSEIIGKLKSAQEEADEARTSAEEKAEEAERKSGDITALEERLTKKHQREMEKLQADLAARDADLRTIRVDNEISKALDGFALRDGMKEVLTSHYKSMAKYENGEGAIEDQPLAEFIANHLNSDVGAHYRKASENSGGNSSGNTSTTSKDTTFTKENFNLTKFSELAQTDPAKANSIAEQLGLPYKV